MPGQCVGTLLPGAKCKLAVTYTPYQGPGLPYENQYDTGGITITDNGSTQPVIYLSGINFLNEIRYSPKSLDFGRQQFDTTGAPLTVKIANPNTVAVNLGSVGTQGGRGQFPCFGIDFTASTCYNAPSAKLYRPAECELRTIAVAYTALKVGSQSGVLYVQSYSGPVYRTVRLYMARWNQVSERSLDVNVCRKVLKHDPARARFANDRVLHYEQPAGKKCRR